MKQIGTLDQFRIPYKRRGLQMASVESNAIKRNVMREYSLMTALD
jgi:hypothetical protein